MPIRVKNRARRFYSGPAWKHHLSADFENHPELLKNNGAGEGATVFINYQFMLNYLKRTGKKWHIARLELNNCPVDVGHESPDMITILKPVKAIENFHPVRYK